MELCASLVIISGLVYILIEIIITNMKLTDLANAFTKLADQVTKIDAEIKALKDALANTDLPADAQAALDRLTAVVQTADDETPDAT